MMTSTLVVRLYLSYSGLPPHFSSARASSLGIPLTKLRGGRQVKVRERGMGEGQWQSHGELVLNEGWASEFLGWAHSDVDFGPTLT